MKVAIPIFGSRVSPRFDFAPSLLLCTLREGKIVDREQIPLMSWTPWQRVEKLKEMRVKALICGGIDGHSAQLLKDGKIQVISWVCGGVEEALSCYLRGELVPGLNVCPEHSGKICKKRKKCSYHELP